MIQAEVLGLPYLPYFVPTRTLLSAVLGENSGPSKNTAGLGSGRTTLPKVLPYSRQTPLDATAILCIYYYCYYYYGVHHCT